MSSPKIKEALGRQALAYMREEWLKEAIGAMGGGAGGGIVGGSLWGVLAGVALGLAPVAAAFYLLGWRRAALGAIEKTATSGREAKDALEKTRNTLSAAQEELALTVKDRDGYRRNCEEIYVPQIAGLNMTLAKYRETESAAIVSTRQNCDEMAARVKGVKTTVTSAKSGHVLSIQRFGLPSSLLSLSEWKVVDEGMRAMWAACDRFEETWGKWYPRSNLGTLLVRTKPDTSESLDEAREDLLEAVADVLKEITAIRNRAEENFRAMLGMDSGHRDPAR